MLEQSAAVTHQRRRSATIDSGCITDRLTAEKARELYQTTVFPKLKYEIDTLIQDIFIQLQSSIPNMDCLPQDKRNDYCDPLRTIVDFTQVYSAYQKGVELDDYVKKIKTRELDFTIRAALTANQNAVRGAAEIYYFFSTIVELTDIIIILNNLILQIESAISAMPELIVNERYIPLQKQYELAQKKLGKYEKSSIKLTQENNKLQQNYDSAKRIYDCAHAELSPYISETESAKDAYNKYLYPTMAAMQKLHDEYNENKYTFFKEKQKVHDKLVSIKAQMLTKNDEAKKQLEDADNKIARLKNSHFYAVGRNVSYWKAKFNPIYAEQRKEYQNNQAEIKRLEAEKIRYSKDYAAWYEKAKADFEEQRLIYQKLQRHEACVLDCYITRMNTLSGVFEAEKLRAFKDHSFLHVETTEAQYQQAKAAEKSAFSELQTDQNKLYTSTIRLQQFCEARVSLQQSLSELEHNMNIALEFTDEDFNKIKQAHKFMAGINCHQLQSKLQDLGSLKHQREKYAEKYSHEFSRIQVLLHDKNTGIQVS